MTMSRIEWLERQIADQEARGSDGRYLTMLRQQLEEANAAMGKVSEIETWSAGSFRVPDCSQEMNDVLREPKMKPEEDIEV